MTNICRGSFSMFLFVLTTPSRFCDPPSVGEDYVTMDYVYRKDKDKDKKSKISYVKMRQDKTRQVNARLDEVLHRC